LFIELLLLFIFIIFIFSEGIYFIGVSNIDYDVDIPVVLRACPNAGGNVTIIGNKASWTDTNYYVLVDKEITEGIYKMFVYIILINNLFFIYRDIYSTKTSSSINYPCLFLL
jgi:hypothetical protein